MKEIKRLNRSLWTTLNTERSWDIKEKISIIIKGGDNNSNFLRYDRSAEQYTELESVETQPREKKAIYNFSIHSLSGAGKHTLWT